MVINRVYRPIRSVLFFIIAVVHWRRVSCRRSRRPANWALAAGLGGNAGDIVFGGLTTLFGLGIDHVFAALAASVILGVLTVITSFVAAGIALRRIAWLGGFCRRIGQDAAANTTGAMHHAWLSWRSRARMRREERRHAREAEARTRQEPETADPEIELSTESQMARLFGSLRKHASGANRHSTAASNRGSPGGASYGLRLPVPDDDARRPATSR